MTEHTPKAQGEAADSGAATYQERPFDGRTYTMEVNGNSGIIVGDGIDSEGKSYVRVAFEGDDGEPVYQDITNNDHEVDKGIAEDIAQRRIGIAALDLSNFGPSEPTEPHIPGENELTLTPIQSEALSNQIKNSEFIDRTPWSQD